MNACSNWYLLLTGWKNQYFHVQMNLREKGVYFLNSDLKNKPQKQKQYKKTGCKVNKWMCRSKNCTKNSSNLMESDSSRWSDLSQNAPQKFLETCTNAYTHVNWIKLPRWFWSHYDVDMLMKPTFNTHYTRLLEQTNWTAEARTFPRSIDLEMETPIISIDVNATPFRIFLPVSNRNVLFWM